MSLSDLACRNAKPQSKPYKIFDSGGLFLDVLTTGKRVWRLKYRFHGKEKLLTIGQYPGISLFEARERKDLAKEQLGSGIDPSAKKQEDKKLARFKSTQTFELVANEWHTRYLDTWTEDYAKHIMSCKFLPC
ncbi:MAG TPA: Arm DNA-binding domain-containing protein [Haloplasmataceae bacterium]